MSPGCITYHLHLAEDKGHDVGQHDEDTADNQGHRRPKVEVPRPQRQVEVGRDAGGVVDHEGVTRGSEDGEATEQGKGCQAYPDAVDQADRLDMALVGNVTGIDLEVRGRRRDFGFVGHDERDEWVSRMTGGMTIDPYEVTLPERVG